MLDILVCLFIAGIKQKVAIVTGGSSGIGQAMAKKLSALGYLVVSATNESSCVSKFGAEEKGLFLIRLLFLLKDCFSFACIYYNF